MNHKKELLRSLWVVGTWGLGEGSAMLGDFRVPSEGCVVSKKKNPSAEGLDPPFLGPKRSWMFLAQRWLLLVERFFGSGPMEGSPAGPEILRRLERLEAKVEAENQELRSELLRLKYRLQAEPTEQSSVSESMECEGKTSSPIMTYHSSESSFWDALLLAGLDMTGLAGTLIIILGVMISASLQLLSIWIVFNFFLDTDDKHKLGDLRDWRVLYGHNINYLDSDAGSSLVAKICNGGLVDRAWWQFQLLDEVNKYLHPLFPGADGLGVGVVLSSCALTIWIFNITAELPSIWSFTWSVWRLPRRQTLVLTESAHEKTSGLAEHQLRPPLFAACHVNGTHRYRGFPGLGRSMLARSYPGHQGHLAQCCRSVVYSGD